MMSAPVEAAAPSQSVRFAPAAVFASIAGFVPLVGASMSVYPGGTSWDPTSRGHDFWKNYLCDLERPTSLAGIPNPTGSALAQTSMLVLASGLFAFFMLLPRLFPTLPRLGRAVRALGALAVLAIPGVVFLPGDRFGIFHGLAVVTAAVPGLFAALSAVIGLALGEARPRGTAIVGAVTLAVAALDFALYVPQVLHDDPGPVAVAVLERVSLGLLLLWMVVVAVRARRPLATTMRG